ncbi:hypothetical protein ADUPG1_005999, partial [Aduncisulcus paluster]
MSESEDIFMDGVDEHVSAELSEGPVDFFFRGSLKQDHYARVSRMIAYLSDVNPNEIVIVFHKVTNARSKDYLMICANGTEHDEAADITLKQRGPFREWEMLMNDKTEHVVKYDMNPDTLTYSVVVRGLALKKLFNPHFIRDITLEVTSS